MYKTNWGIGHGLKDILEAHKGPFTGQGHKGLYEILTTSWHAQLSLNLAMLGSLTIVVAHHMYSMPPYPYLATDYGTQLSLFTHHIWIGGFLIVGAAAHAAIFMVRDYDPTTRYNDLLDRVLRHRDAIISHLNWACIFLGFHSFGLYIHNDTMSALGRPQDMFSDTAIQLQPVFAQWIQNTHALAPGATAPGATASTNLTWGGGDLVAVGGKVALLPIPLGTIDFLVHHIHAFTIHVTVLILLKGVLFARSSRLIPDKANFGFHFPCDGLGRGGTCQVSAWDHIFLGLFWMYNSISVVIFHFSWKIQSDVWGNVSDQGVVTHITGGNFAQSSITINGWLRDFLWAQASQDPLHVRPIAHAIWDPHFGQPAVEAFTRGGALGPVNIAYSGWLHLQPKWKPSVSWFKNAESRLNYHLSGLFGISSLAWTGHLVHVAIPASRGEYVRWNNFLDVLPHPQGLGPLFTGQWNLYAQNPDSSSHLFGTAQGAGTAILTLLGGFHPQTQSLWLTDIAHHHLAIAFIFLVVDHMYRTNFGIGHSMKDLLDAHIPPGGRLGRGHKGLYDTINNSLHFQLGLALASLGVITSLVAQHMYSLPAYAFIAQDFTTQAALYTHH
ncbi:Photosystem I chlorophyll a apoprotein A1 [Capsicum baccatum]|uniref:Photosystem I chlorophyll a apoprotein A1 n=1 Tax=Capsicum baccatum TaxID=33114 RepID=A0A2G2VUF6_CAPBA|nr:Photosystem I chlorophyll a apoprotein A1 [Capsicum baccatum]